jgi:hypothetical protein
MFCDWKNIEIGTIPVSTRHKLAFSIYFDSYYKNTFTYQVLSMFHELCILSY